MKLAPGLNLPPEATKTILLQNEASNPDALRAANEEIATLWKRVKHGETLLRTLRGAIKDASNRIGIGMDHLSALLVSSDGGDGEVGGTGHCQVELRLPREAPERERPPSMNPQKTAASPPPDFDASPAEVRILTALAELHAFGFQEPSKVALALWSKYAPNSGGYNNYLGRLRSAGWIEYPGPGKVAILDGWKSEPGMAPVSAKELQDRVRAKIGPSKARILEALIDRYPESMSKETLAVASDFTANSGGFNNYLGQMRSMGLLDYPSPGQVVASRVLFLEER